MAREQQQERIGPDLWFGLLGGALAWLAHLILAYLIAEFGCLAGWDRRLILGMPAPTAIIAVVSVVLLLIAIAATAAAYRAARRLRLSIVDSTEAEDRQRKFGAVIYMARAGVIMSAIFVFTIVVQSLPILYFLGEC